MEETLLLHVSSRRSIRAWMAVALLCTSFLVCAKGDDGEGAFFNVMASSYDPFYDQVKAMAQFGPLYRGHVVLAPLDPKTDQKRTAPTQWINVTVVGDGVYRAKMLLRNENFYFLAFLNRVGQLFYMREYGQLFQGLGGIELGFGESYPQLLGAGGATLLVNVPLGRDAAKWAASIMSEYDPRTTTEEDIKRAVVIMVVMGPEAFRIHDVRRVFTQNLDAVTHLEEEHTKLILSWGRLSVAFFCDGKENCMTKAISHALEKVGLENQPARWDAILDIMLRPRHMTPDGGFIPPMGVNDDIYHPRVAWNIAQYLYFIM